MKILLHTDSPLLYSGLARCGRELAKRFFDKTHLNNLNEQEHDFEIFYAAWHYSNKRHDFPYFIYPLQKGVADEGRQFRDILCDCNPEIILSIGDIWNFHSIYSIVREYKETNHDTKWILWLTIDGEHMHPAWRPILDYADDINVFSHFARQELSSYSGIQSNVIYPGVDKNVFKPIDVNIKENSLPFKFSDTFLLININQNTDRKNIPLTLEAFKHFSKDKEDVFLLLITDPDDPFGYDLWDFVKVFDLRKKVAITKEAGPLKGMPDANLNLIYNLASVSLNTSIGEGLSLPTLEAMAVGTPIVATNYAAIPELINQGGGIKINVGCYLYGFNGIRRAVASIEDTVNNLNIMYHDYKTDKKIKNAIALKSRTFTDSLTWDKTTDLIINSFDRALQKKTFNFVREKVKIKEIRPLMVIPSWGTHCGIAEYTKSLFDAIRLKNQPIVVFSSYNYEQIPNVVADGNYNIIHLQHEFSFFKNKNELEKLLNQLNAMKIKIVLTMHTLVSGMTSYNKLMLNRAHDLIVHCDAFELELKKCINENDKVFSLDAGNISVMHMGCGDKYDFDKQRTKETKQNLNIDKHRPIIGSFGFLRDQKGFHDFLLCIKLMREKYPDILALLVCPYHEFGSRVYDEAFFNFVERQELSNNVLIIREYLEENKLLSVLQCADVFVLNYQDSPIGGGISAAVKTLFRVQRPIIVNDSIAFLDLKDEVFKIRSAGANSLIEPIEKILNDESLSKRLVNSANLYIEQNSWDNVAQKHLDLYAK